MSSSRSLCRLFLWVVVIVALQSVPANAERRIALVIGNSAYSAISPLPNPVNDADLVAETLEGLGFDVVKILNADQQTMKTAMLDFSRRLRNGSDVSLLYYAGHGVQSQGQNYLVPVDADIRHEDEFYVLAIDVNDFLATMESAPSRVNILIFDACRNNPFASTVRSTSRGLARMEAPPETLIAYSTRPGDVAEDGSSGNSPYAKALATAMVKPGVSVENVFKEVRRLVRAATENRQTPTETTELTNEFYFQVDTPGQNEAGSASNEPAAPSLELTFWNSVASSGDIRDFEAYLKQFPDGVFAPLARNRIAALSPPQTEAVPPAAQPEIQNVPVPSLEANSTAGLERLVAAAQGEGQLNVIALPHDWCNYGEIIQGFRKKYGLQVNEVNPDAGSDDEIEAIRAKGPQSPDVIDVGLSFGPSAKEEGLLMPYKVSTWDTIPDGAKDADGYWYGDYYGVIAFEVNRDLVQNVPQDWDDLLNDEYRNSIALSSDPRTSNQAIQSVYAAGLSSGAAAGADAGEAGLRFFRDLHASGNFVPVYGKAATLAQGQTPIVITWDYNALAGRDALNGSPPVDVVVPKTGVVAGMYAQAISAHAPHPNAAKLWMEYLYSDEGQLGWLRGYCHPVRYRALASSGAVPSDVSEALPPAAAYYGAVFPTLQELAESKKVITENWDRVVGANVQ